VISIAAIVKNEQPYILEWLAYHMVLGVDDFYIADNVSSDGCSELLYHLDKAAIITRISHPTENEVPPQISAYKKILSMLDKSSWVAFIDADEFIFPNDFESGFGELIPLLNDENNGAISLNWAVYGSSYSILPENGLVTERFTWRGVEEHPVNKHYKSIVRVGDVLNPGETPHAFKIKSNKKFIMPNGKLQEEKDGISNVVDWSKFRINHYVIKSKAEFLNKKAARGRATTMNKSRNRNIEFFNDHDLNDIQQSMPSWFVRKVRSKIEDIKFKLKGVGLEIMDVSNPFYLYRTFNKMGIGVIDKLSKSEGIVNFRGWAVDNDRLSLDSIIVVVNNNILLTPKSLDFYDRPDVEKAGIGSGIKYGFTAVIELPNEPVLFVQIYALNKLGLVCVEFDLECFLTTLMD